MDSAESCIREAAATTVVTLAEVTAGVPYYKFNGLWTRQVQDLVSSIPSGHGIRACNDFQCLGRSFRSYIADG